MSENILGLEYKVFLEVNYGLVLVTFHFDI